MFPYVLTSPSLYLLQMLNSTGLPGLQISTIKVVMSTRLPLAFLSVIGYLATGKLADTFHVDRYLSTILYCSSYVTWTYFTRTFSNSIESVLLAILLLLSVPGQAIHNNLKISKTNEKVQKAKSADSMDRKKTGDKNAEYKRSETFKDEIQDSQRKETCIEQNGSIKPFFLGMIVAAGVFNRPTFVAFAFVPMTFWLFRNVRPLQAGFCGRLMSTSLSLLFGILLSCVTFVTADTAYYKPEFLHEFKGSLHLLVSGEMSLPLIQEFLRDASSNLVLTPLNFLMYNTDPSNLAKHGLHPRSLHFFINLPLLLGPVYIAFISVIATTVYRIIFMRGVSKEDTEQLTHTWLVLMAVVPLLVLSIFPHQEPRFLIPALPMFMVMGAKVMSAMAPARLSFMTVWVVFNIVLTLVYGYIHQGALIPAMSIYQQKLLAISSKPSPSNHHAIFYKTYPPPRHLLLLPETSSSHVHIHDLEGGPVASVRATVLASKAQCKKARGSCQIFLFVPATVTAWVDDHLSQDFKLQATSICPHLSMEATPRVMAWWRKKIGFDEFIMEFCLNIIKVT